MIVNSLRKTDRSTASLKEFLDRKVNEYNQPSFIENDPICVPHTFSKKQDIEIAGFFAAVFAWGNRTTIIQKSKELLRRMDNAPYAFIKHGTDEDSKNLLNFKHRTFNDTDLLYFVEFLKFHFSRCDSLEPAFFTKGLAGKNIIENSLISFHHYFFSLDHAPLRTKKHISTPGKNSTCKRLNMFLRWMIRRDNNGVDFGIWRSISPSELICPLDVHVARVAKRLNLITRKQTDWLTAMELTQNLRTFDKNDPVKYDFALFGLGVMEKF